MSSHAASQPRRPPAFAADPRRRARIREPALAATTRLAARITGALTIAVLAVGLTVHVACAGWARRLLAFHFPGVPARPAVAATVFVHNLHALAAIGGALLVAQAPYLMTGAADAGRIHRALRRGSEVLLTGGVAANVVVIGASFGAYGMRMMRAALPHGPLELAAYSLALALYIQGRRWPLAARHVLAVATLSSFALAAAALLETFVSV
jgi:hypothetical protein